MPGLPFALPAALPATRGSSSPGAGSLTAQWIDAAGVPHVLDGSAGITALIGADNFFMPPFTPIEQVVPLAPGARLRYVQTAVRVVDLPLLIKGTSYADLWTKLRGVMTWFDPTQPRGTSAAVSWDGNAQLQLTAPDGLTRVLNCYCASGLECVMDAQNSGPGYQYAVAALRAPDPYWYDAAPTVRGGVNCTAGVLTTDTITTSGDVECWPIWTITFTVAASQASSTVTVLITNTTTGYAFTLSAIPVASTSGAPVAHTIVVDTRPTVKAITYDGTNVFNSLAVASSALFPLSAGANALQYTISEAVSLSVAPAVQCTYTNRYNTP